MPGLPRSVSAGVLCRGSTAGRRGWPDRSAPAPQGRGRGPCTATRAGQGAKAHVGRRQGGAVLRLARALRFPAAPARPARTSKNQGRFAMRAVLAPRPPLPTPCDDPRCGRWRTRACPRLGPRPQRCPSPPALCPRQRRHGRARHRTCRCRPDHVTRSPRSARAEGVDLTMVGPEGPLVAGDRGPVRGRGPAHRGAHGGGGTPRRVEGVRKGVHAAPQHPHGGVPTFARHEAAAARAYAERAPTRLVVKASGLAAGQGRRGVRRRGGGPARALGEAFGQGADRCRALRGGGR